MTTETSANRVPQWTFADRVRKIRREVGMSQTDFADALGRKQQSVASWESGKAKAPRDIVALAQRIELRFGVPTAWTLGIDGGGGSPNHTATVA